MILDEYMMIYSCFQGDRDKNRILVNMRLGCFQFLHILYVLFFRFHM